MAEVVNIRKSAYDVLIARPSKWGNPFHRGPRREPRASDSHVRGSIRRRPDLIAALPELVGKRLGCYCKPEACHGDVLIRLLKEFF